MKYIILMLFVSFGIACQQGSGAKNENDDKDAADFPIQGAYSMIKQVGNNGLQDTLLKKEQLKIYGDRYMMYASPRATDSFGEYGIATYNTKGDTVFENIFYTSVDGQVKDTAKLEISKLPNGYRQVIRYIDSASTFILTEDYDKVGKEPPTPLDGAWKQVKDIFVGRKGDTTRNTTKTQFKIYQSGYFIWANPNRDPSSSNFYSAYGYGTYKMLDSNRSEETNVNSTFYSQLVGKPVAIQLEFTGPDTYKQTILGPQGEKSVEIYERLK
jgi:hypothetical protein